MTARGSWKQAERRIARKLGGDRTPLSGENSRHTSGDAINIPEYLEVKMQPENTTHEKLTDLNKKARRRDRKPLILHEHTGYDEQLSWAAMWFDDYLEFRKSGAMEPLNLLNSISLCGSHTPFLLDHEVGASLTNGALVRDTVQCARNEDRYPIVVIQKKGSSNQLLLLPTSLEWSF